MKTETIKKKFQKIGANVTFGDPRRGSYNIDVRNGRFILESDENVELSVVDVDSDDRHLLLHVEEKTGQRKHPVEKHKFLCGHDERDWFVAAVPESFSVKNISEAKQALKPAAVIAAEAGISKKKKNKRKTAARVRQGEWFFVPAPDLKLSPKDVIHKNEPLSRGNGSKPHMVDEIYRIGGISVMVCAKYPSGVTETHYKKIINDDPGAARWNWTAMTRDAAVYARGRVRHADHATIFLDCWHRVFMNTESQASSRRNMSFLD